MVILGIDPATACGWAALDSAGARLDSGAWTLGGGRFEGGGMRYLRARRHMVAALDRFAPAAVFFEEVRRHAGTTAAHVYGGIIAQICAECEARGVPYAGVAVGVVKRHATGAGNASKAAMMNAARERWHLAAVGEDEADALWIADAGRASLGLG